MNRNPSAVWRQIWYFIYAAGIVAILVCWWGASGHLTTNTAISLNLAIGNLTGLIGTYQILWELVLLSRLTFLENAFGMEKLTWLHKWNGYSALILILAHTVFLLVGYALVDHASLWFQLKDFMFNWEDVLKATIATALLIFIVFISIGIVRRGLKYETWYYVHIFTYLAILLAFSHQLSVGTDFIHQPAFTAFWYLLYVLSVGVIFLYRFCRPAYLMWWHRLRVDRLVQETPSVLSVYVTGRHLDQLKYRPGQFMIWRFFTQNRWWQAHPFSLSVAPNGQYLRITVRQLGDFTRDLSGLKPGTWISVDGPHGNFTTAILTQPKVLLIAGGVGITPIRSMLEQLPPQTTDVVLVYAARSQSELALRSEIDALAARTGAKVHYILSEETVPGLAHGVLDAANLQALVPDVASREVMLCGPPPMMNAVTSTLVAQGVKKRDVHTERFAY